LLNTGFRNPRYWARSGIDGKLVSTISNNQFYPRSSAPIRGSKSPISTRHSCNWLMKSLGLSKKSFDRGWARMNADKKKIHF
jgi:hypothetical protein